MAKRAAARMLDLAAKNNERYFLMFWPDEENVSVHKEEEVKTINNDAVVGATASCKFGRKSYEGKIAGVGNRNEMLRLEKDFIDEKYTPFNFNESEEADSNHEDPIVNNATASTDPAKNMSIDPSVESTTPVSQKRVRKRKLKVNDKTSESTGKRSKTSSGNKESRSDKQKEQSNGCNKKKLSKCAKKKDGEILIIGSGGENSNDSDSDESTMHNKSTNEDHEHQLFEGLDDPANFNFNDYVLPPSDSEKSPPKQLTHNTLQEESQIITLKAIQDHLSYLQTQLQQIHSQQQYIIERLHHMEYSIHQTARPIPPYVQTAGRISSHNASFEIPPSLPPVPYQQYSTPTNSRVPPSQFHSTPVTPSSTPAASLSVSDSNTSAVQEPSPSSSRASGVIPVVKPTLPNLPPVDRTKLIPPGQVLQKYPTLLRAEKLTRLAVRLAQESFFGTDIMKLCTVKGVSNYHALPADTLADLKDYMCSLSVPRFLEDNINFEITWKACLESIGQSCKGLRT